MAWFQKKTDPVTERARALNQEISELEAQIKQLGTQLEHDQSRPRLRSTAVPQGATVNRSSVASPPSAPVAHDPIFEAVDQNRLDSRAEGASAPEHFNDLGVRKYDLPALLRRLRQNFRGPSTTNPRLVSYLAAGGIQGPGMRPLRFEKRVARNRFIFLVAGLFFVLLCVLAALVHRR
jgi:hypothetical protein